MRPVLPVIGALLLVGCNSPDAVSGAGSGGSGAAGGSGGSGGSGGTANDGGVGGTQLRYWEEVLADNPLAYWRLGEPSVITVAQDATKNDIDGDYEGSVERELPGALAGDTDTAARFDALGEIVRSSQPFPFEDNAEFTIEAWVDPEAMGGGTVMSSLNSDVDADLEGYYLSVSRWDTAEVHATFFRGAGDAITQSAVDVDFPTAGAYVHVVATYDGVTLRLYLDGGVRGSVPGGIDVPNPGVDFIIGGRHTQESPFGGVIDEVAVYGYALSTERINAHYLTGIDP